MESRYKFLGHPVHPMLIALPLGLLSTAVVFDVLYVVTGNQDLATFSFWAIGAGIVGGLLAALFGVIDWHGIPQGTRAKSVGRTHGLGNSIIVLIFAVSFYLRLGNVAYLPDVVPLVLGLVGGAMALVTSWLGGELVFRMRVGVDDDANLNATNSLTASGLAEAGSDRIRS